MLYFRGYKSDNEKIMIVPQKQYGTSWNMTNSAKTSTNIMDLQLWRCVALSQVALLWVCSVHIPHKFEVEEIHYSVLMN